jgi:hypothetical protein
MEADPKKKHAATHALRLGVAHRQGGERIPAIRLPPPSVACYHFHVLSPHPPG